MSRLRAPSSPVTPRQQHQTTPIPARVQPPATSFRQAILRRVGSSPRLSEEKFQEVVRLNAEYEDHIRQLTDLLEDTRQKWSQSEKENARLAALIEELQRQPNGAAAAKNIPQDDQLKKTGPSDQKKMEEEEVRKFSSQTNALNKADFSRSFSKDEAANISISMKSAKKRSTLYRSSSVSVRPSNYSSALNTSFSSAASSSSSPYDILDKVNSRRHAFAKKCDYEESRCHACPQKVLPGFVSLKCPVCETICHQDCREKAPSCVPFFEPPKSRDGCLYLEEYCSDNFQPKLPHLIVRCAQYLNSKTSFKGLYVDMSQDDGKAENLLELVLHDPNASNVGKFGPKVASQCILKFLNSLTEPLIPQSLAVEFLEAAHYPEDSQLKKVIIGLPVVHKNVLAYLLLHWKLLIHESSELTEDALGAVVLPVIMRIPDFKVLAYFSIFHRLLALPSSFWCSAIDAAILKCPLEDDDVLLYARGAMKLRQQEPKQERRGRLWG